MSVSFWGFAAFQFALCPALAALPARSFRSGLFLKAWLWSAGGSTVIGAAVAAYLGTWGSEAGASASLIAALALWWHRRRKRRSALGWLGEKSKALRAVLVRRARQAYRPRPVLRPAPGVSP